MTEERAGRRIARQVLRRVGLGIKLLGVCFVLLLLVFLGSWAGVIPARSGVRVLALGTQVIVLALLVLLPARLLLGAGLEYSMRISELLVAILVGTVLLAVLLRVLGPGSYAHLWGAGVFLLVALGASWAWRAAHVLAIEGSLARLGLLAVGWLLVVGAAGCTMGVILLVITVLLQAAGGGFPGSQLKLATALALLVGMLVLPGVQVERHCRRRLREQVPQEEGPAA